MKRHLLLLLWVQTTSPNKYIFICNKEVISSLASVCLSVCLSVCRHEKLTDETIGARTTERPWKLCVRSGPQGQQELLLNLMYCYASFLIMKPEIRFVSNCDRVTGSLKAPVWSHNVNTLYRTNTAQLDSLHTHSFTKATVNHLCCLYV